jgi:hypothetical protein
VIRNSNRPQLAVTVTIPQTSYTAPALSLTIFGGQVRNMLSFSPRVGLLWFALTTAPQLIVTLTERLTTGIAEAYACHVRVLNYRNTSEMLIKQCRVSAPGISGKIVGKFLLRCCFLYSKDVKTNSLSLPRRLLMSLSASGSGWLMKREVAEIERRCFQPQLSVKFDAARPTKNELL